MKIAPVSNNTNFKGKEIEFSKKVLDSIAPAIEETFDEFMPKISKKAQKAVNPVYDAITDKIAVGIGKAAQTNTSKKLVAGLNHFKKPSARMADLASFAITFFYVNNTRKSKKIDEERKMPLMINNVAVTVVSSTMAALIDKGSDFFLGKLKNAMVQNKGATALQKVVEKAPEVAEQGEEALVKLSENILNSDTFKQNLKDYTKRVEKAKSLTIFSFTVRFLVTVLMVPVAGKIVQIVKEKSNKEAAAINTQKTQENKQNDTKIAQNDNKTEAKK